MTNPQFSKDVQDFLFLLYSHKVKYLIVGGEAVIYYGHARLTGDIDIFYDTSKQNIGNLFEMLRQFWSGNIPSIHNKNELIEPGLIIQFGVPPNRIDLINKISGVTFQKAWRNKETALIQVHHQQIPIHYMGIKELIKNKETVGRFKDLDDLRFLRNVLKTMKNKNR
ncbi:MAG: DUF6036 family nucleotidyltransferase [Promethearchaeota archaeon]